MLISVCIPCMNRTYDLKEVMPSLLAAAKASPPVEIVVINYNSQDDLDDYVKTVDFDGLVCRKYMKREFFHMSHARNLSVKAASGEWIVISSTDIFFAEDFFTVVRGLIANGAEWMHTPRHLMSVAVFRRQEFIDAGGFDERMEFYGSIDKDFEARMLRRGNVLVTFPQRLLQEIYTPNPVKVANYDHEKLGTQTRLKRAMNRINKPIFLENAAKGILVANEGQPWGQW